MTLTNLSVICATKDAVHCEIDDEIVILSIKDEVYYGLNPVGAFIWNLIQDPKTVAEISDSILKEYSVEEKTCSKDLMELLQKLLDKNLIDIID